MRLRGQCAIVTGGGAGWGAVIARRLVAEGAQVWLADADIQRARRTAAALGPSAHVQATDVGDAASVRALVEAVESQARQIDVVVNAARFDPLPQPLEGLQEHQFDRLVAVNLKGVYLTACELVPRWKAQRLATGRAGVILNVLEAPQAEGPRAWADAAQHWLEAATRSMAAELAPVGIRVAAITPAAAPGSAGADPQMADVLRRLMFNIPRDAAGTPEALGHAAAWLCSTEAADSGGLRLSVHVGTPQPASAPRPAGR